MVRLAIVLLLLNAATALAAGPDGRAVVLSTCGGCHSMSRVCRSLGRDQGWWEETTARMIVNGARMDAAGAKAAAGFLAALKPGSKPVCN